MKLIASTFFGGLLVVSSAIAETSIISKGSSDWKYFDSGAAPGEQWTATDFDDSTWQRGAAPLGYETDDGSAFKTTVSFGDDPDSKHASAYFRKSFDIADLAAHSHTALKVAADDGAVVYFNGKELGRVRMADGEVTEKTFASEKNGGSAVTDHFVEVPAGSLIKGKNVIAASVHQAGATSSDLYFDVALVGMDAKEFASAVFTQEFEKITQGHNAKMQAYSTAYRAAADDEARAALEYPDPGEANKAIAKLISGNPTHPQVLDAANWLSGNRGLSEAVTKAIVEHHADSEAESFAMFMIYSRYRPDPAMVPLLEQVHTSHPKESFQAIAAFTLANSAKDSAKKESLLEDAESKIGGFAINGRPLRPMISGELFEIRNLSIGQVAPEIKGKDIDDVPFKLSDYRGKVVVLDFWGHW